MRSSTARSGFAPSPARPHQGGDAGGRPETARLHHRSGDLLRHRHGVRRGPPGRNPEAARGEGINLRKVGDDRIGITLDEVSRPETVEAVWRAFGGDLKFKDMLAEPIIPIRWSGSRAISSTRSST
jgi:hypothetical protein